MTVIYFVCVIVPLTILAYIVTHPTVFPAFLVYGGLVLIVVAVFTGLFALGAWYLVWNFERKQKQQG